MLEPLSTRLCSVFLLLVLCLQICPRLSPFKTSFHGILGWMVVKIFKPKPYLEGLVIASSATGNLGNLLLIIVPAICAEEGNPFGDRETCTSRGLSYASFSMALGGFYIWTYSYHLVKTSSLRLKAQEETDQEVLKAANQPDLQTHLLQDDAVSTSNTLPEIESQEAVAVPSLEKQLEEEASNSIWVKIQRMLRGIIKELMEPPTLGSIVGFIFGAVPWLRNLVVGQTAPFRVIQDSVKLLGNLCGSDGTIPSTTLILGANLTQGLRSSRVKPVIILGVIVVRYLALPAIGIVVVKAAEALGFLPPDPLYQFLLMVQFTLPPAMSIGIMTQLFGVGQEECSVIMLWTYLGAAVALALWYAVFMWILTN
ncbi:protein PIN-LIKES 5-like isoform X3 [Momordica charantia]|uniref:Protein PIN-LIKES 5-like isoform X3 n=1 Tax=Momordica charantia TaxID=3673 RepID=A0A6J1DZ04_MOMCH|nr:protein PIN-LIKES 5-like isoform X3 [Momordica charantia]